jgi:hypothetical protein
MASRIMAPSDKGLTGLTMMASVRCPKPRSHQGIGHRSPASTAERREHRGLRVSKPTLCQLADARVGQNLDGLRGVALGISFALGSLIQAARDQAEGSREFIDR